MNPDAPTEAGAAAGGGPLASPAAARLILPDGQEWPLAGEALGIGRRVGNHILVDDPAVSAEHARIVRVGEDYLLLDLRSSNGTFVNGERIRELHLLRDGDRIEVADSQFQFRGPPAAGDPARAASPAAGGSDVELGVLLLKEVLLGHDAITIGRAAESDLVLDDPRVSARHARIVRLGLDYYLLDLGSTNGTFVNEQRVRDVHRLRPGDTIVIAGTPLTFLRRQIHLDGDEPEAAADSSPSFVFADASGRRWKHVRILAGVSIVLWIISLVLFLRFVMQ